LESGNVPAGDLGPIWWTVSADFGRFRPFPGSGQEDRLFFR
jgi:hypothetical protein